MGFRMQLKNLSFKTISLIFSVIIFVTNQIPVRAESKTISSEQLEALISSPIQQGVVGIHVVMDKTRYFKDELPLISITGYIKSNLPVNMDVHIAFVHPDGTIIEYPDWNQTLRPWLPDYRIPNNFQLPPVTLPTSNYFSKDGKWHVIAGLADPKTNKFVSLKAFPFDIIPFRLLSRTPTSLSEELNQSSFSNQIFSFATDIQGDIFSFEPSARSIYYFYEDGHVGHLVTESYNSNPQIIWLNWKFEEDTLYISDSSDFTDIFLKNSLQIKFISSPSQDSIAYKKIGENIFSPIEVREIDSFDNIPLLIPLQESSFIGKTVKMVIYSEDNVNSAFGLSLRFDKNGKGISYVDWTGWWFMWITGWGEFDSFPVTWEITDLNKLIIKFENNIEISLTIDKKIEIGDTFKLSAPFLFENNHSEQGNAFILKVEKSLQETDFIDKIFEFTPTNDFTSDNQTISFKTGGVGTLGKLKFWLPFRDSNSVEDSFPMSWKITSSNRIAITYKDNQGIKHNIELHFVKQPFTKLNENDLLLITSREMTDEVTRTSFIYANIEKINP